MTIHSGELKHKIVFKKPTSSLNDEAGPEVTYTDEITTFAAVKTFNQYRATEANVTSLIGSLDFYVRHATAREAINKDWLIVYRGGEYVIHQIERVQQESEWIRFTAKSTGDAVLSSNGVSDPTAGGNPGSGEPADKSHLTLTFVVDTELSIALVLQKTSATGTTFIEWGDGTDETHAPGDVSTTKAYAAPGTYEVKIYPVQGVVDPTAPMVNLIQELSILKTSGNGVLTIGSSLSAAGFLREIDAPDLGMTAFPALPNTGDDQVRRVSVQDNNLSAIQCAWILIALDAIGWGVGYVDISGNPGAGSLPPSGETAKNNLITKGWTVNV